MRTEEQLIDEGLVSRIECMGEKLEDAKVETTLAASAQFLDLDKCIAFSSGSPIFFPKLSLTSSFSVIDNSTIVF